MALSWSHLPKKKKKISKLDDSLGLTFQESKVPNLAYNTQQPSADGNLGELQAWYLGLRGEAGNQRTDLTNKKLL